MPYKRRETNCNGQMQPTVSRLQQPPQCSRDAKRWLTRVGRCLLLMLVMHPGSFCQQIAYVSSTKQGSAGRGVRLMATGTKQEPSES